MGRKEMTDDAFILDYELYRENKMTLKDLKDKYPDKVEIREESNIFRFGY
jgi:hypothetical protein